MKFAHCLGNTAIEEQDIQISVIISIYTATSKRTTFTKCTNYNMIIVTRPVCQGPGFISVRMCILLYIWTLTCSGTSASRSLP